MDITLVVAAAGTARGEVAGGACWHALRQAKEITLVVAAAASYRYTYGRARRRQATAILRAGAAADYRHTCRDGRLSKHLMQTVDFLF